MSENTDLPHDAGNDDVTKLREAIIDRDRKAALSGACLRCGVDVRYLPAVVAMLEPDLMTVVDIHEHVRSFLRSNEGKPYRMGTPGPAPARNDPARHRDDVDSFTSRVRRMR